ncbi:MAG: LTA synthase family protein [Sneathiellales bacterium]|nr:LTA synthase family protein [Sneathiellales bacterium]
MFTLFTITPPIMYYVSILMLTYRPIFALLVALVTYSVIVVLNNAKFKAVKEPLVYSDFQLFREVIKHPHLYVKYIGAAKLLVIFAFTIAAVTASLYYEKALIDRNTAADFIPTFAFFGVTIGMIYAIVKGPFKNEFRRILLSFGPSADVKENVTQLGLVVCLIFYFFLSGVDKIEPSKPKKKNREARTVLKPGETSIFHKSLSSKRTLPDVVAIQAESFFDYRNMQPNLKASILKNYDKAKQGSTYFGRLTVPAWGAYTMRTEFAFLSGLSEDVLGHHKFNPYLQLGQDPFWTIAHNMKSLGYKTICIHPFASTFFNRRKVFPNLGFDHFIDMTDFSKDDQFGPYIGDVALGNKIIETLKLENDPVFIFAITMENHGAWPLDRFAKTDIELPPKENWPLGCYSFSHYLTHMRNTDQMIGNLTQYLSSSSDDSLLCFYGDHMPNLQNVFNKTGYTDTKTDYFIWKNNNRRNIAFDTSVETLGRLILDASLNDRTDSQSETHKQVATGS